VPAPMGGVSTSGLMGFFPSPFLLLLVVASTCGATSRVPEDFDWRTRLPRRLIPPTPLLPGPRPVVDVVVLRLGYDDEQIGFKARARCNPTPTSRLIGIVEEERR